MPQAHVPHLTPVLWITVYSSILSSNTVSSKTHCPLNDLKNRVLWSSRAFCSSSSKPSSHYIEAISSPVCFCSVNLKHYKRASYFTHKTGFTWEQQRIAILDTYLWRTTCMSGLTKERRRGTGRGCYKQKVHWRELGVQSIVVFYWLSYCQARRKPFFFLLAVVK